MQITIELATPDRWLDVADGCAAAQELLAREDDVIDHEVYSVDGSVIRAADAHSGTNDD